MQAKTERHTVVGTIPVHPETDRIDSAGGQIQRQPGDIDRTAGKARRRAGDRLARCGRRIDPVHFADQGAVMRAASIERRDWRAPSDIVEAVFGDLGGRLRLIHSKPEQQGQARQPATSQARPTASEALVLGKKRRPHQQTYPGGTPSIARHLFAKTITWRSTKPAVPIAAPGVVAVEVSR